MARRNRGPGPWVMSSKGAELIGQDVPECPFFGACRRGSPAPRDLVWNSMRGVRALDPCVGRQVQGGAACPLHAERHATRNGLYGDPRRQLWAHRPRRRTTSRSAKRPLRSSPSASSHLHGGGPGGEGAGTWSSGGTSGSELLPPRRLEQRSLSGSPLGRTCGGYVSLLSPSTSWLSLVRRASDKRAVRNLMVSGVSS